MSQSPFLRRFLSNDPTCTRINANNAKHAAMKAVMGALYIIPLDLTSYTPELRASIVQQALRLHENAPTSSRTASLNTSSSAAGATEPPQPSHDGSTTEHSWDAQASNFDIVLSAWEIALHFQLAHISHYVMSQLLLPLLDRRNVVRCLKGALKHQNNAPDAQAVLEWCTDNHLLPPDLDTSEAIAEWETLCTKYVWLRDVGGASQIGLDDVTSPVLSPPSARRHHREHNDNVEEEEGVVGGGASLDANQQPHTSPLLDRTDTFRPSSTTPYVTQLHSRSVSESGGAAVGPPNYFQPLSSTPSARTPVPDKYSVPQRQSTPLHRHIDTVVPSPAGVMSSSTATPQPTRSGSSSVHDDVSPQRQQMMYLSDRAQRHLHEQSMAHEQELADEAMMAELDRERELLRIEEEEFQLQSQQWKSEIEHLTKLLQDLEKEDLDVVESQAALDKIEAQAKEAEVQLSELRRTRSEAEEALKENDAYLRNTSGYLPAAAAAEQELSGKVDELASWVSKTVPIVGSLSPPDPATGAMLRQMLAEYAASLRKDKDNALRSLESELRIEDALRQHIHTERNSAMELQSLLDAHAANLSER